MRRAKNILVCLSFASLAAACTTLDPGGKPANTPPLAIEPAAAWTEGVALATSSAPAALEPVRHDDGDPTCKEGDLCQGESCCTRIALPEGRYHDAHAGEVAVGAFSLDKYELTVGRVRRWVEAGSPVPHEGEAIGRDSSGRDVSWGATFRVQSEEQLRGWERYDTWSREDPSLPKNNLDWYTAAAVCHFAGGRLPTDAEWRYAAVGGEEGRAFPWGSAPQTPERAVYNCMGDGDKSCSGDDILSVGSRPLGAGRWGHMDLAGSLFEWTADAAGGNDSVSRGGGFCYIGGIDRRVKRPVASENVRHDAPSTTSHMVGARCAFDVKEAGHGALAQR
jgi:formylglycine-generating enzyme required for sulfatase activity